jgi:hypothetical protein
MLFYPPGFVAFGVPTIGNADEENVANRTPKTKFSQNLIIKRFLFKQLLI